MISIVDKDTPANQVIITVLNSLTRGKFVKLPNYSRPVKSFTVSFLDYTIKDLNNLCNVFITFSVFFIFWACTLRWCFTLTNKGKFNIVDTVVIFCFIWLSCHNINLISCFITILSLQLRNQNYFCCVICHNYITYFALLTARRFKRWRHRLREQERNRRDIVWCRQRQVAKRQWNAANYRWLPRNKRCSTRHDSSKCECLSNICWKLVTYLTIFFSETYISDPNHKQSAALKSRWNGPSHSLPITYCGSKYKG